MQFFLEIHPLSGALNIDNDVYRTIPKKYYNKYHIILGNLTHNDADVDLYMFNNKIGTFRVRSLTKIRVSRNLPTEGKGMVKAVFKPQKTPALCHKNLRSKKLPIYCPSYTDTVTPYTNHHRICIYETHDYVDYMDRRHLPSDPINTDKPLTDIDFDNIKTIVQKVYIEGNSIPLHPFSHMIFPNHPRNWSGWSYNI